MIEPQKINHPEIRRASAFSRFKRTIDGHVFIRPRLSDIIPRPSLKTASRVAGIALAVTGSFGGLTQHKVEAYGAGPTPTTIPDRTPIGTPTPPEAQADFHTELDRLLNLSPEVDIGSPDGMYSVGISKNFMSSNRLADVAIDPDTMQKVSDLIQDSLSVIAKAKDESADTINFGVLKVPLGTDLRLDIVSGQATSVAKGGGSARSTKAQYQQIQELLKRSGISFQTFKRLNNKDPQAESLTAFFDGNYLHLIVNGHDVPSSLKDKQEGKLAFLLASAGALVRRYAATAIGVDAWKLEDSVGATITSGDDVYGAFGCTVENGGCAKSSGGVIKITSELKPTATPPSGKK